MVMGEEEEGQERQELAALLDGDGEDEVLPPNSGHLPSCCLSLNHSSSSSSSSRLQRLSRRASKKSSVVMQWVQSVRDF